jgi:hypothetical protein
MYRKKSRRDKTDRTRKLEAEEVTKSNMIEVCKEMLAKNRDINDIVDCTGLSEEEIEEIKKKIEPCLNMVLFDNCKFLRKINKKY